MAARAVHTSFVRSSWRGAASCLTCFDAGNVLVPLPLAALCEVSQLGLGYSGKTGQDASNGHCTRRRDQSSSRARERSWFVVSLVEFPELVFDLTLNTATTLPAQRRQRRSTTEARLSNPAHPAFELRYNPDLVTRCAIMARESHLAESKW